MHDTITKEYYTLSFPTKISIFFKHDVKDTLALKFVEEISIEKGFRYIGVIFDREDSKHSKDTSKNSQASSTKAKEKYPFDMDNLTKS